MPARTSVQEMTEVDFLALLRQSTERYLAAVDAWEAQYRKFYRVALPGSVSPDIESLHQHYLAARREFEACVPRARYLCHKYELREPWQAMLHIRLGADTPQVAPSTAIGRAERSLIIECMAALESAVSAPEERPGENRAEFREAQRRGILKRFYDYFF
jgi:hypothetical protein